MNKQVERISGYEDILDSRDIQKYIEWLKAVNDTDIENMNEDELDELYNEFGEGDEIVVIEELEELLRVKDDTINMFGYDAWDDGITFINDDYFPEYIKIYLEESGIIDVGFISCHVNWEGVARDMSQDYRSIDIFGERFWIKYQSYIGLTNSKKHDTIYSLKDKGAIKC